MHLATAIEVTMEMRLWFIPRVLGNGGMGYPLDRLPMLCTSASGQLFSCAQGWVCFIARGLGNFLW